MGGIVEGPLFPREGQVIDSVIREIGSSGGDVWLAQRIGIDLDTEHGSGRYRRGARS